MHTMSPQRKRAQVAALTSQKPGEHGYPNNQQGERGVEESLTGRKMINKLWCSRGQSSQALCKALLTICNQRVRMEEQEAEDRTPSKKSQSLVQFPELSR